MKKILTAITVLVFISFAAGGCCRCKPLAEKHDNNKKNIESVEFTNLPKGEFVKLPNISSSHLILIEGKPAKSEIIERKNIYIFDKSEDEILLKDFIPLGKVFWKSDSLVQVEKFPGTITTQEVNSNIYTFNIITKEKSKK